MNTCSHPPNIPPVTVHQIVRYLGRRYAHAIKQANWWATENTEQPTQIAAFHREEWYNEAFMHRRVLNHLKHGHVTTWRIGSKANRP